MDKIHYLKTWPEYFWNVVIGNKRFEVRKDDRDYQAGDKLVLQEFDPEKQEYTGKEDSYIVSYLLRDKPPFTPEGYVIMSLTPAEEMNECDQLRAANTTMRKALERIVKGGCGVDKHGCYIQPAEIAQAALFNPTAQREAERWKAMAKVVEIMHEVAFAPPTFNDARINFVEIQVARESLKEARKALADLDAIRGGE